MNDAAPLNTRSRMRWVITTVVAAWAALSLYFLIWGYASLLREAESGALMRLAGIVNTLALQIDGDAHQQLMARYPAPDDINRSDQDSVYARLHALLRRNATANMLATPVYTIIYDSLAGHYAFGVTSAAKPYFRHPYHSAPALLMEKHSEGAMIPMYEDEFGAWLSAFASIKNVQGVTVALVQADLRFDDFIMSARREVIGRLSISLLVFLALLGIPLWIVRPILAREEQDKQALTEALAENRRMSAQIQASLDQVTATDAFRKEMVANLSHDLRTPLASVMGYLETLQHKGERLSAEERSRFLNIALTESRRLNRLVADLFDLSRLEGGQIELAPEPFSLAELAQDVLLKYRQPAEAKGVTFRIRIDDDLPLAMADIRWVDRVLQNLFDNALRYVDEGGFMLFTLFEDEGRLHAKVCNTGKPLPPDMTGQVFDRYFTASNRKADSSGLGLAIVRQIILLHGERVWAESSENLTTFRFTLPVYAPL